MLVAMTRNQRCAVCHERKPRNTFSVANGICMECFDRSYGFCEECGTIVYHRGQGITSSRHPRSHTYHGETLCNQCSYDLQGEDSDRFWRSSPFDVACVSYERIGSKRKYGVEIETCHCRNHRNLSGRTKFGAKSDCTIDGLEFDSPILYGDEGLEYIEEFLTYGADNNWAADMGCGCHTHYDVRNESRDQLISIAYAYRKTQSLWEKLVPSSRVHSSYSYAPNWNLRDFRRGISDSDVTDPGSWIGCVDCQRYEMVNFTAYYDHNTIEVRSLEGTVDPETICNWIAVNCRFIDGVRNTSLAEIDNFFSDDLKGYFEGLSTLIGNDDLIAWLKKRAASLHDTCFE